MLRILIDRWRLWRLLRASGMSRRGSVPPYVELVLQRPAARDWMARRGIRDVKALGPSSPPRC